MSNKFLMITAAALVFSASFLVGFKNADVITQSVKPQPKIEISTEDRLTIIKWEHLDIETNIVNHPPEAVCLSFNFRKKVSLLPLLSEGRISANLPNGKYHLEIYTCRVVRLSIPQLIFLSLPQLVADFEVKLEPQTLDI